MKNYISIFLATFLGAVIPMAALDAYQTFILIACDPKLGCVSGFQFDLFILSASGCIASLCMLVAYFLLSRNNTITLSTLCISVVALTGIAMNLMSRFVLPDSVSTPEIFIIWFFLCLSVSLVIMYLLKNITRHSISSSAGQP